MSKNFITFVHFVCTEQIYKHFKQNKQTKQKKVVFVVIYIHSKLFNSISNRVGGYYRKKHNLLISRWLQKKAVEIIKMDLME